jgi:hypothetical protein
VNFARFAVPLRIGLALGTTPWVQENIVDRFLMGKQEEEEENSNSLKAEAMVAVLDKKEDETKVNGGATTVSEATTASLGEEEKAETKSIILRVKNLIQRVFRRNR